MKNIFKISLMVLTLGIVSCSEPTEYELPYELSPTTTVGSETTVTAANAVCPAPTASFTVDSESSVYYVVQLTSDEALTSEEVFEEDNEVVFSEAGTNEIELAGLDLGEAYTIYSITVNANGTRSEQVSTVSFTMPNFSEVVDPTFVESYIGTVSYGGTPYHQFEVSLTNDGGHIFSASTLWGDAIAGILGNPAYEGMFQYPGTINLEEDFSLTVESAEWYAIEGSGVYDPCTGTFSYDLLTSLFGDPEEFSVELVPAE